MSGRTGETKMLHFALMLEDYFVVDLLPPQRQAMTGPRLVALSFLLSVLESQMKSSVLTDETPGKTSLNWLSVIILSLMLG